MSRRNLLSASLLACLPWLVAVVSSDASAQSSPSIGKIVFARSASNPDGTVRSSSLFRMNADGTRVNQLTPTMPGIVQASANWSPGGGKIAYTQFDQAANKYDIRVMDSQGGHNRQITFGTRDFYMPVWGPGDMIAFVYERAGGGCVGTIRADGSDQKQELFCPPREGSRVTRVYNLMWSADGNDLFVDAGYPELDEAWFHWSYKVDARTGVAMELFKSGNFYFRPDVSFSPDGSNALYAGGFYDDENYEGITRIDFATGRKTLLIDDANDVYAPLYSKDGSRFAFTRTITSGDQRYDQLFVANADGTDVRQLTTAAVGNLAYTAVEWSDDGSQLLVDRFLYTDQIPRVPLRKVLRIVDVNTGAIKGLPGGYAYGGGWFNH